MKIRIYKKRRARYSQACERDSKRLRQDETSEEWHKALNLYASANHWYCRKNQ